MHMLELSVDLMRYMLTWRQPTLASIAEGDGECCCVGTAAAATASHNQIGGKTGSRGSGTCHSIDTGQGFLTDTVNCRTVGQLLVDRSLLKTLPPTVIGGEAHLWVYML